METTASCEMLVYLIEMTDNSTSTVHVGHPRFTHAQIIFSVVISCSNNYNCQSVFKSSAVLVHFIPFFSNYSTDTKYSTRPRVTPCFNDQIYPAKDKKQSYWPGSASFAFTCIKVKIKI